MQVQEELQAYDDINVTPMLDLAYVLLVIFIIMTTASVQGVKVELPKTKNTASLAKPGTKAVTISERGDIFLDAYPVTLEVLGQRIDQLKGGNPSLPIVVKGDGKAHYGKVMAVLELLKSHDITDVGLVTVRAK
ncbi:biopolymer transporter ExbD [Dechloromonas sp. HYN0024]|uniref:ExbD/TolR family protein n=1 Tax=Dechloromonas sp. HYN0024 TaxID=2231055 RepID=UPI000E44C2D3|nr:biopolymer transporter ExbD [Dechloromonas sp. HYN0024]AXS80131.1 biopolymer transporter ExbD [Dechloromonas sp. HYN0024]